MVNINYELDDDTHRLAKMAAAATGISLKQYIMEAIAAANRRHRVSDEHLGLSADRENYIAHIAARRRQGQTWDTILADSDKPEWQRLFTPIALSQTRLTKMLQGLGYNRNGWTPEMTTPCTICHEPYHPAAQTRAPVDLHICTTCRTAARGTTITTYAKRHQTLTA